MFVSIVCDSKCFDRTRSVRLYQFEIAIHYSDYRFLFGLNYYRLLCAVSERIFRLKKEKKLLLLLRVIRQYQMLVS